MDDQTSVSKTQRKRDSLALQELGEELTRLSPDRLAELDLPEPLLQAILEAGRIGKFGAQRRQRQYIGRLMHDVDSKAIAARLEFWKGNSLAATTYLRLLERWRERLLEDEGALGELAQAYPVSDTQRLRQLLRNTRREHDEGKPRRSYRALYQELRRIIPDPSAGAALTIHPDATAG
jgi:ribosome-associated protein